MLLSDTLCDFLYYKNGAKLTRATVYYEICDYIKRKNLDDPNNPRHILPDERLAILFNYNKEDGEPLTYYHLMKKLSRHLTKVITARYGIITTL